MEDTKSQRSHKSKKPFKPTLAMIYFWKAYADPMTKADLVVVSKKAVEMMREDGVTEKDIPEAESIRRMTYKWEKEDYPEYERYQEWKQGYWTSLMKSQEALLDKIGIQRAVKDFRYWKGMQEKYMGLKKKIDITTNDKDVMGTEDIAKLLQETLRDGNTGAEARPEKGEVS